jgi:hypothetical protein
MSLFGQVVEKCRTPQFTFFTQPEKQAIPVQEAELSPYRHRRKLHPGAELLDGKASAALLQMLQDPFLARMFYRGHEVPANCEYAVLFLLSRLIITLMASYPKIESRPLQADIHHSPLL